MNLTMIIVIVAVAAAILALISLAGRSKPKCIDKLFFKNEWSDILVLQKDYKTRPMSVVNADKLLDSALKGMSFKGDTMAERLVSAKGRLKARDAVWSAHKLRNKIVHDSLHEPTEKEVKTALDGYRKAFRDLGVF